MLKEPSYPVGGNLNWWGQYGEQYGDSLKKNKNRVRKNPTWSFNSTHRHVSGENHNSKRYMPPNVHCSIIYNSQDMKET